MMQPKPEDFAPPSPEWVSGLTPERAAARAITHIETNDVVGGNRHASYDVIAELLEVECKAVANGDMTMVRRTLASQIRVLERLYDHLLDRAMSNGPSMIYYNTYMKLAFRAQTQLNTTVSLLHRFTVMEKTEDKKETPTTKRPTPTSPLDKILTPRAANHFAPKRQTELAMASTEATYCKRTE